MYLSELMSGLEKSNVSDTARLTFSGRFQNVEKIAYNHDEKSMTFLSVPFAPPCRVEDLKAIVSGVDLPWDEVLLLFESSTLEENNNNLVRWFATDKNADFWVELNSKADEDVFEELRSRIEYARENGKDDQWLYATAFDDGFTLRDFKRLGAEPYERACAAKKQYNLAELQER